MHPLISAYNGLAYMRKHRPAKFWKSYEGWLRRYRELEEFANELYQREQLGL